MAAGDITAAQALASVAGAATMAHRSAYRVPITIPAQAATLTNFPVAVDLSLLGEDFWGHLAYRDGRDIRVRTEAGVEIPFDLISVRPIARAGSLFAKVSLPTSGSTVVYIHCGDASLDFVPVGAANGRNAVWADYHRVHTFGANNIDRTGSGSYPKAHASNLNPVFSLLADSSLTSPQLSNAHQGVCWDGAFYYVFDTNRITKYDAAWKLIATNTNPVGDVGNGTNHLGDGDVVGGILYVTIENYTSITTWSAQRIARFNASDLSFIDSVSVSAQGQEVSSAAYSPHDGYIYLTSYADGSALRYYDRTTLAYVGSLPLSTTVQMIQGITFWEGAIYLSSDFDDKIFRVELDGTVQEHVWGVTAGDFPSDNLEGLSHNDDGLLALHDQLGNGTQARVYRLVRRNIAAEDGARFVNAGFQESGVTRYTTWTMGVSVRLDVKSQNRAVMVYGENTATPDRAGLTFRNPTDQFGLWNPTDSWLMDTINPVIGTIYRLHATHNGTTERQLYRDGVVRATDSGIAAMPGATADSLFFGIEDLTAAEMMEGQLGFAYLRPSVLSSQWIAAEYLNLTSPLSFFTVGTAEPIPSIQGAQTLAGVSQTATGTVSTPGIDRSFAGAQTLAGVAQAAAATARASLAGTQPLAGVTQTATTTVPVKAAASQSLAGVTQAATGIVVTGDAVFSAAQTLDAVVQAAAAVATAKAAAVQTLGGVGQSAAADVSARATGAQTLDAAVGAATAIAAASAQAAQTLAAVSQAATATVSNTVRVFVAAQVLASVVQVARVRPAYTFERNERTVRVAAEDRSVLLIPESRRVAILGERRAAAFTD